MSYGVGKTNVGITRKNNEDSIFVSNEKFKCLPNIYIVADGMGGHNAGEVASSFAIKYFCDYVSENTFDEDLLDFLISGVQFVNEKIYADSFADEKYSGMGTTFSASVIFENKLYAVHVGDSRIYKIRNKELEQITSDHTYVWEMVKSGQLSKKEALIHPNKNFITRALGVEKTLSVDGILKDVDQEDKILLCSDGLTNMVSDEEILKIVNKNANIDKSINTLILSANNNGGEDNISVILIEKVGN